MLFVGFSMTDPNYLRIIGEVRAALDPTAAAAVADGPAVALQSDRARWWPAIAVALVAGFAIAAQTISCVATAAELRYSSV